MSRWIEVEPFLKEYCEPYPHVYMAMSRAMADAPSIDLVRCGECRWSVEDDYKMKCWNIKGLNKTDGVVNPDDFCSYGVRKENE